ncbi:MAG: CesT family type III secretion system chaperone [Methylocystis sp.]|uniref:CesT family type III secretion system chaperone n=1 Tax=Methylocystis sp. TaxID=1911079 RepID=UPI003DA4DC61
MTTIDGERIDRALAEIGKAVGASLVFDEHRVATIECAQGVLCSIEAPRNAEHVYFHAPVSRLPKDSREAALLRSLRLNLFGLSLPGAWVALDEASDELVLCYAVPGALIDGDRLAAIMAAFVEQAAALPAVLAGAPPPFEPLPLASGISTLIRA